MKRHRMVTYTRYPVLSVAQYNGTTIAHYALGAVGVIIGYRESTIAYGAGFLYLGFSLLQMYVLLPLLVCRNCVYYAMADSRCISGLNIVSRRMVGKGEPDLFAGRARGLFCHNNLYMASLLLPIIALIPALALSFSPSLLLLFLGLVGLLLYRIFVLFPKVACVHCRAKNVCPNARSMGIGNRTSDIS